MRKDKVLSMLGLARRAGRLSMGHDMAQQAIKRKKAKAVFLCADSSDRLKREFEKAAQQYANGIPVLKTDVTMDEIHYSVGSRAGVITIDDENFSSKIISLLEQEEEAYGD